jgi:hypothetical protein
VIIGNDVEGDDGMSVGNHVPGGCVAVAGMMVDVDNCWVGRTIAVALGSGSGVDVGVTEHEERKNKEQTRNSILSFITTSLKLRQSRTGSKPIKKSHSAWIKI